MKPNIQVIESSQQIIIDVSPGWEVKINIIPSELDEIKKEFFVTGDKVKAVKLVRKLKGLDLRESFKLVKSWE